MKIFWVSPYGDGWSMAERLRTMGNKVVFWNMAGNNNGAGYVPAVSDARTAWKNYAEKADAIIVDNNLPSRKTRRSWSPNDLTMDLAQYGRYKLYLGPTATTELLENDKRYQTKILDRLNILTSDASPRFSLSRDPSGRSYLVLGHTTDAGHMARLSLPLASTQRLAMEFLEPLTGFLKQTVYGGYINVDLAADGDKLSVVNVRCRFTYPEIVMQLPEFLANSSEERGMHYLVTLLRLDDNAEDSAQMLGNTRAFFGAEIQRHNDRLRLNGDIIGAIGVHDTAGPVVQQKMDQYLGSLGKGIGWCDQAGFLANVFGQLSNLSSWGYL